MNNHTALDWIIIGDLDQIIGKDYFSKSFSLIVNRYERLQRVSRYLPVSQTSWFTGNQTIGVIFIQNPGLKATEPMQCLIDDIMAGVYIPRKFKLSSNPFRRRNWRLLLSYMSSGIFAPLLLQEWFFLYRFIFSVANLECNKVRCVFPIDVVSIMPHAEFGPNNHREDASHFTKC